VDASPRQHLRVLDGSFVIERGPAAPGGPAPDWTVLVRGPEGVTVVRPAGPDADADDRWAALYSGGTAHDLDVPGMLAALLGPLATAGVPVFVASTYDADLVLVPFARLAAATEVLGSAGHRVTVGDGVR
jgi:uncharacterized protein